MPGYASQNRLLNGQSQTVSAPSDVPVSSNYKISEFDADNHQIAIKCSGTSGTVNLQLQHTWDVDEEFVDVSGATVVAANGTVIISTTGPLWPVARVVAADGGGSVTVEAVYISRRT
jgi:hypothetical protein